MNELMKKEEYLSISTSMKNLMQQRSLFYKEIESINKDLSEINLTIQSYITNVMRLLSIKNPIFYRMDYYISDGELWIRGFRGHKYFTISNTNEFYFYNGDGQYFSANEYEFVYNINLELPKFTVSDVEVALSDLLDSYGIKSKIHKHNIMPDSPGAVRTYIDVNRYYYDGKAKLIGSGKKWYMGWDIPDNYVIIDNAGVKEVWFSKDAHGGGLTSHAIEGTDEYDSFLKWVDENSHECEVLK